MILSPARLVPVVVLAALAGILGFYLWQIGAGGKDISRIPSALLDKPVPEFALPPITGLSGGLKTADLRGKPSLVNVWASWCAPCRAEHPVLMQLAREGVPIHGINIRDRAEDARAFIETLGNPYTGLGADINGRVSIDWGVYGVPETFIVDGAGRIRHRHVGPINPGDLENVLRPVLRKVGLE